MFTKKIMQIKYVIRDITKIRGIFVKLNIQRQTYVKKATSAKVILIFKFYNNLNFYL